MRTYRVGRVGDNYAQPFRVFPGAFSFVSFDTADRRVARRVVRLARRLGFADVKFWDHTRYNF